MFWPKYSSRAALAVAAFSAGCAASVVDGDVAAASDALRVVRAVCAGLGICVAAGAEACGHAESAKIAEKISTAADRLNAVLAPVRNFSVVCFERVTSISVCEAEPVRNGAKFTLVAAGSIAKAEARPSRMRSLPASGQAV